MKTRLRPGHVVLYDNGWTHNDNGRPHVVIHVCPTRGIRLCPLTSSGQGSRQEHPLPARPGGLRFRSWVAATDSRYTANQLLWVDQAHLGRTVCTLTASELIAVKLTALTQLKRRKFRVLTTV